MDISRKNIYTYLANLFKTVTTNLYRISIPVTLGDDAVANGFIVMKLGNLSDKSEFDLNTYAEIRATIQYFVPSINTTTASGVMNTSSFDNIQTQIDAIITSESEKTNQKYTISRDGVLSMDDFYTNNTNSFYVYITSFLITID